MASVRRARLVTIGNLRGLRLAKPLLEQLGLTDVLDIQAASGVPTIRPVALRTLTTASPALEPPEASHRR